MCTCDGLIYRSWLRHNHRRCCHRRAACHCGCAATNFTTMTANLADLDYAAADFAAASLGRRRHKRKCRKGYCQSQHDLLHLISFLFWVKKPTGRKFIRRTTGRQVSSATNLARYPIELHLLRFSSDPSSLLCLVRPK